MKIHSTNIMLKSQALMESLCKPLFMETAINSFEYVRYHFNGFGFTLATYDSKFTEDFFRFELHPSLSELYLYPSSYAYVDEIFCKSCYAKDPARWKKNIELLYPLQIRERFYILKKEKTYVDIFGFIKKNSDVLSAQVYLENLPYINNFISVFEKKAERLISDCEKEKVKLGNSFFDFDLNQDKNILTCLESNKIIHITDRQQQCLSLVAKGYTMKSAAKKLMISPRTVEHHLQNIKEKYKIKKKNQLIDLWNELIETKIDT